jgi:hypothetical protein
MKNRKIINEKLSFTIGNPSGKQYKDPEFCTWEELIATKGPLPTDTLNSLFYKREDVPNGIGNMDMEDISHTYYVPQVTVIRPRLENDEEYFERMKTEEEFEKQQTERERLEYLRLKAKFE